MPTKRKRKPHNLVARETTVKMQLRLPKSRHRELKRAAKGKRTSLHAEILRRLVYGGEPVDRDQQFVWMVHTIQMIWNKLHRADSNGQQAATWTTPKSWAEAQKRPPQAGDG